jgi:hypothetical protein
MAAKTMYIVDGKKSSEKTFRQAVKSAQETYVLIGNEDVPSTVAAFVDRKPTTEWLAEHKQLKHYNVAQAAIKKSATAANAHESIDAEMKKKLRDVPRQFFDSIRTRGSGHRGSDRSLGSPATFALLFQDCAFGGASLWLPTGAYADLRRVWPWSNNWNDRVSSLQLFLVAVWLFENIQFGGRTVTYAGAVGANTNQVGLNCLVADGFNDKASSAIVF